MTKLLITIFTSCLLLPAFGEVDSIHISSRLDPNAITITGVDIIFLYDADLLTNFPATKSQWYSNKRGLTQSAGTQFEVISIFVPQGFDSTDPILPDRKSEAIKVFIFAEHDDAAASPFDVTDMVNVLVEIDPFGIVVSARN